MMREMPIIRMTAAMSGIPPGVSGRISVWASLHPPAGPVGTIAMVPFYQIHCVKNRQYSAFRSSGTQKNRNAPAFIDSPGKMG